MACSDNFIGELQEQLQAWAPSLGCRPNELYRFEERRGGEQAFSARVVLLVTTDAADNTGTRDMPWSRTSASKKSARHAAARAALEDLRSSGARPHDPAHVPPAGMVPSSTPRRVSKKHSVLGAMATNGKRHSVPGAIDTGSMTNTTNDDLNRQRVENIMRWLQQFEHRLGVLAGT